MEQVVTIINPTGAKTSPTSSEINANKQQNAVRVTAEEYNEAMIKWKIQALEELRKFKLKNPDVNCKKLDRLIGGLPCLY